MGYSSAMKGLASCAWVIAHKAQDVIFFMNGTPSHEIKDRRMRSRRFYEYWTAEENARPVSRESGISTITRLEQKLYAENIQHCVPNYGAGYVSETYEDQGAALDTILNESLIAYI